MVMPEADENRLIKEQYTDEDLECPQIYWAEKSGNKMPDAKYCKMERKVNEVRIVW